MKVDGTTTQQPNAPQQVDPAKDQDASRAGRRTTPGADRVDLSHEAALLAEALQIADQSPDQRDSHVEQMRQRLANDEVGRDVARLADRMIDHLLEQS